MVPGMFMDMINALSPSRTSSLRPLHLLIVALAALMLLALPGAAIADTLKIAVSADPVEDSPHQITFSGTAAGLRYLHATTKPAAGRSCASNFEADDGETLFDRFAPPQVRDTWSQLLNRKDTTAGDRLVCAWISTCNSGFTDCKGESTTGAATELRYTARVPRHSGTISFPNTTTPGTTSVVDIVLQTEVARNLYVDLNAPGVACGANYRANSAITAIVDGDSNHGGPFSFKRNVTAPGTVGVWTFCAYVQQGREDTAPELAFSRPFTALPAVSAMPAPTTTQTPVGPRRSKKCAQSKELVKSLQRSISNHRKAERKLSRGARSARKRATRRHLKAKAAKRRKSAARLAPALSKAKRTVDTACS